MKNRNIKNPSRPGAAVQVAPLRTLACLLCAFLVPALLHSQAEPSALLELQSTDRGFLLPRMTQAQRDAIAAPATGLMIYNTTVAAMEINHGSTAAPSWQTIGPPPIGTLDCNGSVNTGVLVAGQLAAGVSANVPYTGGNGGPHPGQTVASTAVTGLTATLAAGNFANGPGSLVYTITGTPASAGTAAFALDIGRQACTLSFAVGLPPGVITTLNCGGAVTTGVLAPGLTAAGVGASVPYTGGDGNPHPGQTVTSTGVTGLTATLAAGNFANGSGNLAYTITGTPASAGMASFALDIGGQACTLSLSTCGAYVDLNEWKAFLCHNLASANTTANPLTPSWEIIGGYWQWGQPGPGASQWLNTNTPNFAHGPTGFGSTTANSESISGWSTTIAPDGAWLDVSKTPNDPCPPGFRVPTRQQWVGIPYYNTQSYTGTWTEGATNYSSGRFFGPGLMLPAAGFRNQVNGQLFGRGIQGHYWSSQEIVGNYAWYFYFSDPGGSVNTSDDYRRNGKSLRCIAE
jgi:uncharacterized protein (TIGR02145 family)